MILLDLNQILFSNISTHNILTHMLSIRNRFKEHECVLCCDSKFYWRKSYFPYYKIHRKENREKSNVDWNTIFKTINTFKQDLKTYFPYKYLEVDNTEADDIIAVITKIYHTQYPIIIVSSDSDFKQLQQYPNVKQFNPFTNTFIISNNPIQELKEKIIKGDSGDGIPNILSNNTTIQNKIRQSPITKRKLQEFLSNIPHNLQENYKRNEILIDFNYIPHNLQENIINTFNNTKPNPKQKLFNYMVNNKLTTLLEHIGDF